MKHLDERVADITWREVGIMFLVLLAWDVGRNYFSVGLDATDKDAWHRSGVIIVVDYGTGQEYLVTPKGGGYYAPVESLAVDFRVYFVSDTHYDG